MTNNSKNHLKEYFHKNEGRVINKWMHYFDIYDRHFSKFRNKPVVILEIGVSHGGSLQMWKDYFGPQAQIIGVDINPQCKEFEEENISIYIGSQSDRNFLKELKSKIPKVDILIDDGGHTMKQQQTTFEELFDHIKDEGIYLCEDLHTSYWLEYGGGLKRRRTFIEFSKNFIDHLHAFHSRQSYFKMTSFTKTVNSLHYYDSILVIEKKKRIKPYHEFSGKIALPSKQNDKDDSQTSTKIKFIILLIINKILSFFRLPGFIWK